MTVKTTCVWSKHSWNIDVLSQFLFYVGEIKPLQTSVFTSGFILEFNIHSLFILSFVHQIFIKHFLCSWHTGNTEGNNPVSGLRQKQFLRVRTYENIFIVEVTLNKITVHFHNLCSFPRLLLFLHVLYHPIYLGRRILLSYLTMSRRDNIFFSCHMNTQRHLLSECNLLYCRWHKFISRKKDKTNT